ncbi:thioredoxin [Frisingicoccus sp.]|uniref:thioredoxin n=1 Tax=Frisingicoccus sp. TaxID=1918627 RepID=UPI0039935A48
MQERSNIMAVIELTQENYQKEVIESDKPVLIDFFATWCGPCKMVSPVVDEIANERPDIKVCKLDVDKNLDLARTFQVMSVPTLVAMKNGEMINKIIGAMPKAQILKMFD